MHAGSPQLGCLLFFMLQKITLLYEPVSRSKIIRIFDMKVEVSISQPQKYLSLQKETFNYNSV